MVFRDVARDGTIRLTGAKPADPVDPVPPYRQEFTFTAPAYSWTMYHGRNTKAMNIITFDSDGSRLIGDEEYVDNNTIRIHWYFPTSGSAVLHE